jgi:hypothetical protein
VTPHDIGVNLLAGTRQFLISVRSLAVVAAVLLLLWPALSRLWDRLWSPQQNPRPRPPEWP